MTVGMDFYLNIFGGTDYPELDRLLLRAANEIDSIILAEPEGEMQKRQYSFAVCAQAEYMGLCGGAEAWAMSVSGNASSFSIGSFSMSRGGSASTDKYSGICGRSLDYLSRSGLLYRGCSAW